MTSSPPGKGAIGVFDSGVGGLTVVRRILELLPNEQILFVADQAHVPYGGRSLEEVSCFARSICAAMIETGVKAIVMACNISTATALQVVQRAYPEVDVSGVIAAGARAAVDSSAAGRIGVLATAGTVKTGAYTQTIRELKPAALTIEVSCPKLVPLIEAAATETDEAIAAAREYTAPILEAGADVIVLGCTHYPFMLSSLRAVTGSMQFIDPAEQTIRELAHRLSSRTATGSEPAHRFYSTGDPKSLQAQVALFLGSLPANAEFRRAEWSDDRLRIE